MQIPPPPPPPRSNLAKLSLGGQQQHRVDALISAVLSCRLRQVRLHLRAQLLLVNAPFLEHLHPGTRLRAAS